MTLRYPDLTPSMLGVLRLDAALTETYGDTRSAKLLAGHAAWKSRTPQVVKNSSGNHMENNDLNPSRDLSHSPGGVR